MRALDIGVEKSRGRRQGHGAAAQHQRRKSQDEQIDQSPSHIPSSFFIFTPFDFRLRDRGQAFIFSGRQMRQE
jgi:hypothetical protein